MSGFRIVDPERELGGHYRAILMLDGRVVGRVERGWSQGGRRADEYVAKVGHLTVADARTLADLRAELRDPEVLLDARAIAEVDE